MKNGFHNVRKESVARLTGAVYHASPNYIDNGKRFIGLVFNTKHHKLQMLPGQADKSAVNLHRIFKNSENRSHCDFVIDGVETGTLKSLKSGYC